MGSKPWMPQTSSSHLASTLLRMRNYEAHQNNNKKRACNLNKLTNSQPLYAWCTKLWSSLIRIAPNSREDAETAKEMPKKHINNTCILNFARASLRNYFAPPLYARNENEEERRRRGEVAGTARVSLRLPCGIPPLATSWEWMGWDGMRMGDGKGWWGGMGWDGEMRWVQMGGCEGDGWDGMAWVGMGR